MLAYPLLITVAAGTVLIFLSVLVVPIFREISEGFGLELPALTKLNLAIARGVENTWPYLLVAFALVLVVLARYLIFGARRSARVSNRFVALFGRTTAIARLSQFMADLLEAGLTVSDTLEVAGFLTNRRELRSAVWGLADDMQGIRGSAEQPGAPRKFAAICYALRAEMPTPSRVRLLRELSLANAEKVRLRLSWTRGLIEPVAILVIGCMVALVVFSLFIPLIELFNQLTR
jgi:type II secretory pathway component PulF